MNTIKKNYTEQNKKNQIRQDPKMFLPPHLRDTKKSKTAKINRMCKFFGHNLTCPFIYREGKCQMLHCDRVKQVYKEVEKFNEKGS